MVQKILRCLLPMCLVWWVHLLALPFVPLSPLPVLSFWGWSGSQIWLGWRLCREASWSFLDESQRETCEQPVHPCYYPLPIPSYAWFFCLPCVDAEASNPPPDQSPLNDLRPQHWVEQSKNGDSWVLSKDGSWFQVKFSTASIVCQKMVMFIKGYAIFSPGRHHSFSVLGASWGTPPKFAWPSSCPATKLYINGKSSMKSPSPDNYIMPLADFYSNDSGSELWYNKLVTWFALKVKGQHGKGGAGLVKGISHQKLGTHFTQELVIYISGDHWSLCQVYQL